jgi:hypothetical protein
MFVLILSDADGMLATQSVHSNGDLFWEPELARRVTRIELKRDPGQVTVSRDDLKTVLYHFDPEQMFAAMNRLRDQCG